MPRDTAAQRHSLYSPVNKADNAKIAWWVKSRDPKNRLGCDPTILSSSNPACKSYGDFSGDGKTQIVRVRSCGPQMLLLKCK